MTEPKSARDTELASGGGWEQGKFSKGRFFASQKRQTAAAVLYGSNPNVRRRVSACAALRRGD